MGHDEPVAQAITILQRLTVDIRAQRGGDSLWRVLHPRPNGKEHISAEIVRSLNSYRDHLNGQFSTPGSPIVAPGPGGIPWRLTTRQFRRTVAWHIANRPFGLVAGKIQYKHASITAFEGYAGESPSGFRREIERERALGQLDDVLEYIEQNRVGECLTVLKRDNRAIFTVASKAQAACIGCTLSALKRRTPHKGRKPISAKIKIDLPGIREVISKHGCTARGLASSARAVSRRVEGTGKEQRRRRSLARIQLVE